MSRQLFILKVSWIMYSQAVIIAKYTLTESLEQGFFYNNDQLTVHYSFYT